jgi:sulfoxide reductase heme-binding subunit YedZ
VIHTYRAIAWNRQKKLYDLVMLGGITLYLSIFIVLGLTLFPAATIETLFIRAFGTCALLLLHFVLAIGPMTRIWPSLLPLLYNRRHLGVATFATALIHGSLSTFQFHAHGDLNPLVSLIVSNTRIGTLPHFPFELLGLAALSILFLMAATSHDFWLANLTPPVWKALHMLVYMAYFLIIAHVLLGVLQAERNPLLAGILVLGIITILTLHLVAGFRERRLDRESSKAGEMVDVCGVEEIDNNRAKIVCAGGERVAIFKYDGLISAISNVCRHQNGPLGEGRIVDGCVTCPWHGFQYLPQTGAAPAPFKHRVATYRTTVKNGRVFLYTQALPLGTRVEPSQLAG